MSDFMIYNICRHISELSGVNFNDITEETLKKGKMWLKYYQKKEKKTADLIKKFAKVNISL